MDVEDGQELFQRLKRDLSDYEKSVEEKISEDLRPKKLLKIDEVVPISAKFGRKSSVPILRDSIRLWMDRHDDDRSDRNKAELENTLVALNDERGIKLL